MRVLGEMAENVDQALWEEDGLGDCFGGVELEIDF